MILALSEFFIQKSKAKTRLTGALYAVKKAVFEFSESTGFMLLLVYCSGYVYLYLLADATNNKEVSVSKLIRLLTLNRIPPAGPPP